MASSNFHSACDGRRTVRAARCDDENASKEPAAEALARSRIRSGGSNLFQRKSRRRFLLKMSFTKDFVRRKFFYPALRILISKRLAAANLHGLHRF
jgi:hypothetical protein